MTTARHMSPPRATSSATADYITTRITADGRDGYRGRARPLPPRRVAGLPVGEPGDHRAAAARPRAGAVDGDRRADPRRAQLDVRPRPRRPRPGARHRALAGRVLRPRSPTTTRGSRCRRWSTSRPAQVVTNDFAQMTLDFSTEWRAFHREGAPDLYPDGAPRRDRRGRRRRVPRRQQRRLPVRLRRHPGRATSRPTGSCSTASTGCRSASPTSATWWATRSPRPTCGCSPTLARFDAVYHGHFKCNRSKLTRDAGAVGLRPRPVPDPGLRRHDRLRRTSSATTTRSTPTSTRPASCRSAPTCRAGSRRTAGRRSAAARSATAPRRSRPFRTRSSILHAPRSGVDQGSGAEQRAVDHELGATVELEGGLVVVEAQQIVLADRP